MEYFDKYKESKFCLYTMVCQFMTTSLSIGEAKKEGIENNNSVYSYRDYVEVCYHDFSSEGLLTWDYLNFKKDFISHEEIWNLRLNLKNEEYNENIDYQEKFLKNSILLIDLTKKYYGRSMPLSEAKEMNIPFDEEDDEFDDEISTCFHIFESAGENVWNLFEIENPIVGESIFDNIREKYCNELLKKREHYYKQSMNIKKVKKLTKNQ